MGIANSEDKKLLVENMHTHRSSARICFGKCLQFVEKYFGLDFGYAE